MILLLACTAPSDSDSAPADTGVAACTAGIDVGECPPDVSLVDQDGAPVSLLSFAGAATVIASETGWCSSCQDLAEGFEALYTDRRADGLVIVDVIVEGVDYAAADGDDAADWADYFELTYPVLADPEGAFLPAYGGDISSAPFVFYVLDGDGVVTWNNPVEDGTTLDQVTVAVNEVLGE